ncbi:MAG: hypothetical protein IT479_14280 [Xanthomonadales bacterium]|nr:hypothetical protein [Xanthomonadales bacterium]MCE7931104.1 hypothetical protein [Xanthomonadales bacterium PRO6]
MLLAPQAVGIEALAAHPRKSAQGLHGGRTGRVPEFAGCTTAPGDWTHADADTVPVSPKRLHAEWACEK